MRRPIAGLVATLLATQGQASNDVIEELVVTATKRPATSGEISYAIDAIGSDEVRPLLTDSLRSAIGVFVQQTTPGQGAAIIRGLKGSSILHLVDGFRLNNAIFRSAPTQYLALVPPAGVERIEVLRGTPTSLYGSDAVGGIVQVVMRRPEFETPGWSSFVDAEFNSAELSRMVQAGFETGTETLAAGVYANHLRTGNRRTGSGDRVGPTDFEASGLRAVLNWSLNSESTLLADLQYQRQPSTPRFDELNAGFGQTDADSDEYFFEPNDRLFAHLEFQRSFGDVDWTVNAGIQEINDDRRTRNTGSTSRRVEANRSRLSGLSSRWSGEVDSLSWVAGLDVYRDEIRSSRVEVDTDNGGQSPLDARFPDGSEATQAALYFNGSWTLNTRTRLSGGLRYSTVDVDLAATTLTVAESLSVNDPSGDIGLLIDLSDRWQWTVNAGVGFRAPNVFDAGTLGNRPGNRFNTPNTSLESEHVVQFDTGFRYRGERVRAEVVAWALDYDERITSVSTGLLTPEGRDIVRSVNAASSELYGLEAGFDLALSDRWSLHGLLNIARGEQRIDGVEEPADRMPPVNGRLSLEFAATDNIEWVLRAAFAGDQDRLSARDVRDNRIDPDGTPGWVTVDAGVSYTGNRYWTLALEVNNMLDRRYRYHGSGLDAPGRGVTISFGTSWGE